MKNHKYFFYIIFAAVVYLSFRLVLPYLSLIVFSFLTAILLGPLYDFIYVKTHGKKILTTVLSIFILFLCFCVPLVFFGNMIINQANELQLELRGYVNDHKEEITALLNQSSEKIQQIPGIDFEITEERVSAFIEDSSGTVINFLISNFTNITFLSINFVGNLFIFILLFADFLPNRERIINFIKNLSPLDNEIDDMYFHRVFLMTNTMLKGTFLIAFVQSCICGLVMWILGVDYIIFWIILMIICGIIPMIGTGLVSVPIGIALILSGQVFEGTFIVLFSILVVANIDNLMRATLVPKDAKIHPMLLIISLVGGIKLFGSLGFLYGPLIMILLVTTIEIYFKYYKIEIKRESKS